MKQFLFIGGLTAVALTLAYVALKTNTTKPTELASTFTGNYSTTTNTQTVGTSTATSSQIKTITQNKNMNTVTLQTNKGTITLELSADKPKTTDNFKKLVSAGFYDGIKFHRIIAGFMIQSGDPQSKDESLKNVWGTGGPGYKFEDELTGKETYPQGTLAMANSGSNTNGSQFFIVTAKNAPLPASYTVFGKVTAGMEVALAIEGVETDASDKPLSNVTITKATLK
jgi:cyclophilin family peptidyl-prolyl cis-trans isomerase